MRLETTGLLEDRRSVEFRVRSGDQSIQVCRAVPCEGEEGGVGAIVRPGARRTRTYKYLELQFMFFKQLAVIFAR